MAPSTVDDFAEAVDVSGSGCSDEAPWAVVALETRPLEDSGGAQWRPLQIARTKTDREGAWNVQFPLSKNRPVGEYSVWAACERPDAFEAATRVPIGLIRKEWFSLTDLARKLEPKDVDIDRVTEILLPEGDALLAVQWSKRGLYTGNGLNIWYQPAEARAEGGITPFGYEPIHVFDAQPASATEGIVLEGPPNETVAASRVAAHVVLGDSGDVTGDGVPDLVVQQVDYGTAGGGVVQVFEYGDMSLRKIFEAEGGDHYGLVRRSQFVYRTALRGKSCGSIHGCGDRFAWMRWNGSDWEVTRVERNRAGDIPASYEVLVYFYPRSGAPHLDRDAYVGVPREVRRSSIEDRLEGALTELVQGPTRKEQRRGLASIFSRRTQRILRDVSVDGHVAVIDFRDLRTGLPAASTSAGGVAFRFSLGKTVFQFPTIQQVEYRMRSSCDAFWEFLQATCHLETRSNWEKV